MRRYPEYKDSGVEWIGEIPVHLEVKAVEVCCRSLTWVNHHLRKNTTVTSLEQAFLQGNAEFGLHKNLLSNGKETREPR